MRILGLPHHLSITLAPALPIIYIYILLECMTDHVYCDMEQQSESDDIGVWTTEFFQLDTACKAL